jgi:hypothetical protein
MKMVKSLLLGSAAGLAALTGAQAADLPMKAKPVEYVKICSLYGAGFYYIPGTDTCIRIGGHIRSEVSINSRGTGGQQWFTDGSGNNTITRDRDFFFVRNRVFVNTDTRTQTSFGTLRTFSVTRFETNTGTGLASGANVTAIDAGIIQWGGFTIGRAGTSYFDNPWAYAFKWGAAAGWSGNPDTAGGRFVAAYTHQFGNGISGTISLEDNKITNQRGIYNGANSLSLIGATGTTPAGAPNTNVQGGNTWPSVVGQLQINQAWGGFSLSAEVGHHHVAYNCGNTSAAAGFALSPATGLVVASAGCSELAGNPSDKVGGAVNAAFKFNVPTGVNDALYIGGTYSKGDGSATWGGVAQGAVMGVYGGGGNGVTTYGSITGSYVWDSVYTSAAATTGAGVTIVGPVGQQLTTGYGGSIAFEHGWNAEWRTSVFGGAQVVDYGTTANAILCSKFGAGSASGSLVNAVGVNISNTSSCNWDYRLVSAGTRTYWTPVRDLTIGLELIWTNHHVAMGDGVVYNQPLTSGFKPAAAYVVRDQNIFSGMFSVRRFF